jgi:hypothetical protein
MLAMKSKSGGSPAVDNGEMISLLFPVIRGIGWPPFFRLGLFALLDEEVIGAWAGKEFTAA